MHRYGLVAALAVSLVGLTGGSARAERDADDVEVTSTVAFALGAAGQDGRYGFAGPGGHFDLGVGWRRVRLAIEAEVSLWTDEDLGVDNPDRSGRFRRLGGSLRLHAHNFYFGTPSHPRRGALRLFAEVGAGRQQRGYGDRPDQLRDDVTFGIGLSQSGHLAGAVLGGFFGWKVIVARSPTGAARACAGPCPPSSGGSGSITDAAFLFTMGLVLGH